MKYISIRVVEAEDHGDAIQAVKAGDFLDDVQVEGYDIADKVLPLMPELSEAVREAVRLQIKADNALMRSYSEEKGRD